MSLPTDIRRTLLATEVIAAAISSRAALTCSDGTTRRSVDRSGSRATILARRCRTTSLGELPPCDHR